MKKNEGVVRHPWDRWFAYKRSFRLIKGKHYQGKPHAMAVQVRNAATARGLRMSIQIDDDGMLTVVKVQKRRRR